MPKTSTRKGVSPDRLRSSSEPIKIENLYERLGGDGNKQTYAAFPKMQIELPANIIITGRSGTMKSNLACNIIQLINMWTRCLLFAKNPNQPLYQRFIESFEKHGGNIFVSNDLADLPPIEELEEPTKTIVLFDDLLAERNLKQVEDYFLRGRNHGISQMFISQKHHGTGGTPLMIRENCGYAMVKKVAREKGLRLMFDEYGLPDDAMEKYKDATARPEDFFMIDLKTSDDRLRMRHNFEPFNETMSAQQ